MQFFINKIFNIFYVGPTFNKTKIKLFFLKGKNKIIKSFITIINGVRALSQCTTPRSVAAHKLCLRNLDKSKKQHNNNSPPLLSLSQTLSVTPFFFIFFL